MILRDLNEVKEQFLAKYILSSNLTKMKYRDELNLFLKICDINTMEELNAFDEKDIAKFFDYSKGHNWSANTTNQRLATAKVFFQWCFEKKYINNNYLKEIKRIRTSNTIHYTPKMDDCNKLLMYIKKHTKKQRLYLMVKLLLSTGLRLSELCNIKTTDLNFENSSIKVIGKGKKIVEQPVPIEILNELKNYINTERQEIMNIYINMGGQDKNFLFVSGIGEDCNTEEKNKDDGDCVKRNAFYQQLKRYAVKAGLPKAVSPHALRRCAGTTIYEQTGDIKTASEFLRHSSVTTTERCYVNYDKTKLINAVNQVFANNNQDKEYLKYLELKKKFEGIVS